MMKKMHVKWNIQIRLIRGIIRNDTLIIITSTTHDNGIITAVLLDLHMQRLLPSIFNKRKKVEKRKGGEVDWWQHKFH